jgi:hypothetical protein
MSEDLHIVASYYQDDVIDAFTHATNEVNPMTGYYTMLATSLEGRDFSQWTEGAFDPHGENAHLGRPVCIIGKRLVEHVLGRLAE